MYNSRYTKGAFEQPNRIELISHPYQGRVINHYTTAAYSKSLLHQKLDITLGFGAPSYHEKNLSQGFLYHLPLRAVLHIRGFCINCNFIYTYKFSFVGHPIHLIWSLIPNMLLYTHIHDYSTPTGKVLFILHRTRICLYFNILILFF